MIVGMARSHLRQRDKLVARAESVRSSIADGVVAPLAREIAALQGELQALSDAANALATHAPGDGSQKHDQALPARAARPAPVVFLHVPKTAGTTVTIWLRLLLGDLYSKAAAYSAEPGKVQALAASLAANPGSVDVVAGHLPYATRAIFPSESRFFTFLREPIDRSLSHYWYFRERELKEHASPPPAGLGIADLEEALSAWDPASPASRALLPDNLQTRMLSGADPDATSSLDMLAAAKRNLRAFDVVGLTARFHESMALLHHVYGWKLLAIPGRRIRTHQRPAADALPPAVHDALRRLNVLDEELYSEGARVFEASIERHGDLVARDAAALRRALEGGAGPADGGPGASEAVVRRTGEILADTQAALDRDLLEQAHGLAMTLVPHTTEVRGALASHLRRIAELTRDLTALVRKQQARMEF